jgi:hypothetical protein
MINDMEESSISKQFVSQYRASLAMLRNAIETCPEDLWLATNYLNRFWHIAYHAVFLTHLYVQSSQADFQPWTKHQPDSQHLGPRPSTPTEERVLPASYSKEDVLEYLQLCNAEVDAKVPQFGLWADSGFHWLPFNRFEVHLYNIRHLQHHTGQLADRLRTVADIGVPWIRMG